jgi:gamma-glutamyltranspeptidase / glutathione hydrolase
MKRFDTHALIIGLLASLLFISTTHAKPATAKNGVIATVHPLATQAGIDAFERGGNAIDAAVAAALTLGVVDTHNSGIGGGCFALIRLADGTTLALDGREMAPAKATRDMFIRDGKADPTLSQTGPLAIGIPGSLAVYDYALTHGGKLTLKDLITPAADIAEQGFTIDPTFASRLAGVADKLAQFPDSAALMLDQDGKPWPVGHLHKQPDLAKTYRAIARDGIGYYYKGPFAQAVQTWMADNQGLITAQDFANYTVKLREPVISTYRGYQVIGFSPPSSGGIHVAQILNILEHFDLANMAPATRAHVTAQAMKLAFADRTHWLGDPDFADVPRGLADADYANELAQKIDLNKTITVESHSTPPDADTNLFGRHTTHIAAADSQGNWIAITATLNTSYGSKVLIPGTGVFMNNQMDDFSAQPGTPNYFGLLGAEANSVQPGKRPLSSMSPTIVLKDGQPVLTLGAAGGPTIITQVVQTIINHIDLKMPLPDAVAAPRIHHQWRPDRVVVEKALDPALVESLKELGHEIQTRNSMGITQAIALTDDGNLIGVHDPRASNGSANGYDRPQE